MKTLYSDILYNSKIISNDNCICTFKLYQFSLDFTSLDLQLKISLSSNYLGTNSVVVNVSFIRIFVVSSENKNVDVNEDVGQI